MRYALPDLAYDYSALQPHMSARIVELHHDRHHRAYVEGANKALDELAEARERADASRIGDLERTLAFNVSGHVLHSLFWQNLTPHGGGEPDGELAAAIRRDFGSFKSFRTQLSAAAATVLGSGWGALVYDPLSRRLGTAQFHDHQSNVVQAGVPLLVIDAWEHAYYLQYENEKKHFFDALWNLWNWPDVATRFAAARELDLSLRGAVAEQSAPTDGRIRPETPARGNA
jgi:Fe-Mn family superoxide dismutase